MELQPNKGKNLVIEVDGKKYARYPIKTRLITPQDKDIVAIVAEYAKPHVKAGDIVLISEKTVAITQGRSYPIGEVKPSFLATWLSRYVTKTPVGIGLGSPQTMQLAVEEVGVARILLAAVVGGLGKLFGIKGLFYIIAGPGARSIDGAVSYALPPYNTYVSKGPAHANEVAKSVSEKIGTTVVIVDANDLGVNILGTSEGVNKKLVVHALKDNPLGQSDEQTPIGILREIRGGLTSADSHGLVRKATPVDAQNIATVAHLLHLDMPDFVWSNPAYIAQQVNRGEYFMIEEQGMVVGIMSMRERNYKMHIETLVVKPEFQSRGFGTLLLNYAKHVAQEKGHNTLHAYSFTEYNIENFYLKKGFQRLSFTGNYQGHSYHCFAMHIS